MSNFHRRDFLTGAAAIAAGMTAGLVGTRRVEAGNPSFMNNVPDPLLSGKELPTFKFALENSKGKVIGKSFGKEATVEQLPISKGIAGVSMKMEPGAMRFLNMLGNRIFSRLYKTVTGQFVKDTLKATETEINGIMDKAGIRKK